MTEPEKPAKTVWKDSSKLAKVCETLLNDHSTSWDNVPLKPCDCEACQFARELLNLAKS